MRTLSPLLVDPAHGLSAIRERECAWLRSQPERLRLHLHLDANETPKSVSVRKNTDFMCIVFKQVAQDLDAPTMRDDETLDKTAVVKVAHVMEGLHERLGRNGLHQE
jgi:hypothetical protein